MKTRILLVDDEVILLMSWQLVLQSAGYDVETASTGAEALNVITQKRPDLVITDLFLEDMNGVEVCRAIKENHPRIEVAMVSGLPEARRTYLVDFINEGGNPQILSKPLSTDDMLSAVASILNNRQSSE